MVYVYYPKFWPDAFFPRVLWPFENEGICSTNKDIPTDQLPRPRVDSLLNFSAHLYGYFVALAGMPLSCIWFKLSLPSTSPCIASWPYWPWQTWASVWLDAQIEGLVLSVLLQHFLHPLSFMESAVLVAMNHLVTIWFFVLRICAYWTPSGIGGYGAGHTEHSHYSCTLITSIDMWLPSPRCFSCTDCLHQDTIHLACSDSCFSRLYELYIIILAVDSDVLFILLSYAVILLTVLAIASAGKRLGKYTHISHIPVVLWFMFLFWTCPVCTELDNTPHAWRTTLWAQCLCFRTHDEPY